MAMPSGYKRLEYIKANGSQLINSGFVVNTSDIRLFGEFEPTALGSTPNPMFGCYDSGSSGPFFSVEFRDGYFFCARGTGVGSSLKQATVNTKYSVDFSLSGGKFSLKVDGTEIMNTTLSGSINTKNPYGIMGVYYNSGTSLYPANMKCYGLKQYSGETLVRDYIPCETETGEIGLWDDVNSVFYGNAGTGTFTAGPEVPMAPKAPTGFSASPLTDTTVKLSWTASDGATGYKLYKLGDLLATLTDTSYTDTLELFSGYTYSVTAYNDDGESEATTLIYHAVPENPILYLVTDRTAEDVTAHNVKGTYRSDDMNRVGAAMEYVADRLKAHGYDPHISPKTDWKDGEWVDPEAQAVYLGDLAELRKQFALLYSTPEVPPRILATGINTNDGLTHTWANDIEKILEDIDTLLTNAAQAWFYSGELFSGEV